MKQEPMPHATVAPESTVPIACSEDLDTSVWIVADSNQTCNLLKLKVHELGFTCKQSYVASNLCGEMSNIITKLHEEKPALVWISRACVGLQKCVDDKVQGSVRLLADQQHMLGGHLLIEDVSLHSTGRGLYLNEEYLARNSRACMVPVWWCALGVDASAKQTNVFKKLESCALTSCFTTLTMPLRITNCCKKFKFTGRSVLPSRLPKSYYLSMAAVILETVTLHQTAFAASVKKRKQKPKSPKPTAAEGPGEHVEEHELENFKPKKDKSIENVFDDCGDDTSTIMLSTEESMFDSDSDWMSEPDEMFDNNFFSWGAVGSQANLDENLQSRPFSKKFDSMQSAFTFLMSDSKFEGQHDVCELFGGLGSTTQLCIRRKLKGGPNFDISVGIDLTLDAEVEKLFLYWTKHRPKVLLAGPPCTSFSAWSQLNRVKNYEAWIKSRRIGIKLAEITLQLCIFQRQSKAHFIIENPASSELWRLPGWSQLLQNDDVFSVILDQCVVGLKDPTGEATKKPTMFIATAHSLIRRLAIRCPGHHSHVRLEGSAAGHSRCKFAQVWPRRLIELLADGITETLKAKAVAFPALAAPAVVPAAVPAPIVPCPGCVAHARKDDPRHSRQGACKFPNVAPIVYDCPACRRNRPSTYAGHKFDATCQWTVAPRRHRGNVRFAPGSDEVIVPEAPEPLPPALRPRPNPAHVAPLLAPASAMEPMVPPPIPSMEWKPLTDMEMITALDQARGRDGWHYVLGDIASAWINGRALTTCEPRYSSDLWKFRSSFGYFPACVHTHGSWWQLESYVSYLQSPNTRKSIGYPVPVLIIIFHKEAPTSEPIENITRKEPKEPVVGVGSSSASSGPPIISNPHEHGQPDELPPEVPAEGPAAPLGEEVPNLRPEWSHFDLASALRALRSGDERVMARAMKRLHIRWFHSSTAHD